MRLLYSSTIRYLRNSSRLINRRCEWTLITAHNEVGRKVMFSQASVGHSVDGVDMCRRVGMWRTRVCEGGMSRGVCGGGGYSPPLGGRCASYWNAFLWLKWAYHDCYHSEWLVNEISDVISNSDEQLPTEGKSVCDVQLHFRLFTVHTELQKRRGPCELYNYMFKAVFWPKIL